MSYPKIKLDIDLSKISKKTISYVYQLFVDSGIDDYINKRETYDERMKEGMRNYFIMNLLSHIRKTYKRISLTNIQASYASDNWVIDKLQLLSKYDTRIDHFNFITKGIIDNIYIKEEKDKVFYKRMLNIFNEYCVYHDIFILLVPAYPDPYAFTKDIANIIKYYYDFIKYSITHSSIELDDLHQIYYMFACADIYFPLLENDIENRYQRGDISVPNNDNSSCNIILFSEKN